MYMNRILWKHATMKKWLQYFLVFLLAFTLSGCGAAPESAEKAGSSALSGKTSDTDQEKTDVGLSEKSGTPQTAEKEIQGKTDAAQSEDEDTSGKENTAQSEDEENPKIDESSQASDDIPHQTTSDEDSELQEDGVYTSRDEVAQYIFTYGHLPSNFITKKEAKALGWEGGGLEPYAPGKCIGGSRFGNYEGLLPEKEGRVYTECDIDTLGADSRGAKRIVFSNDGLIYYTEDHYESFELLYGEE